MAVIPDTAPLERRAGTKETGRPRWYGHRLNRPVAYRLVAALGAWLPRAARLRVAAALAPPLRALFAGEWQVVRRNMARIAPGASPARREELATDVFRHFAMCFSDLVVTNRRGDARAWVAGVEGRAYFDAALGAGRGLIVLTAHLGNWELAGRLMAVAASRPTHVVVEAEADPRLESFLRGGPAPVRFVARRRPTDVLGLVAALRRAEVVAMQGDRALGTRADVTVPFFGGAVRFPAGPFFLARAAEAVVVPAFCVLGPDRRYTVQVREPITVGTGGEEAALGRWVAVFEDTVRTHPEQWFNFFDCWSPDPGA